jgi:type II secretory pathway component PulF
LKVPCQEAHINDTLGMLHTSPPLVKAFDVLLGKMAEFYESEVEAAVKVLSSIIELRMIAVVSGVIIAIYLPMSKLYDLVK